MGFLQGGSFGKDGTNFFTSLWNKPETRDERVKEYVPEVLEESLQEQRAVLRERTSRDAIVELGHKILHEMENKSPTPSIAPHLSKLLKEYGAKDLIAQRPLSYLLYPTSSVLSGGEQPHELVSGFSDNFRTLIEEVERNGCSARREAPAAATEKHAPSPASGEVVMASKEEYEPMDITMFIKVASGMALANAHCNDFRNAVRCVDAGIAHAIDGERLGGLLGLKAGLLVHQRRYDEAAETAKRAVEVAGNVQGFLHGAYALRMLRRYEEAVALLEKGVEEHPMNTQLANQLEAVRKSVRLSLTAGDDSDSAVSAAATPKTALDATVEADKAISA